MKRYTIIYLMLVGMILSGCESPPQGMVLVPGGNFTMGSDKVDTDQHALKVGLNKPWYADESPSLKLYLKDFYIDKYEVTRLQYYIFCQATDHKPPRTWGGEKFQDGTGNHSVGRAFLVFGSSSRAGRDSHISCAGRRNDRDLRPLHLLHSGVPRTRARTRL